MNSRSRRGFTLVELLVAMLIFVMVAGSLYKVLNVSQRTARTQTERAAMQGTLRTGLQLAVAEIAEIYTDQAAGTSGITGMTATQLNYQSQRGFGISCTPDPIATAVRVRQSSYTGLDYFNATAKPVAGQTLAIFDEGPLETTQDDDNWREYAITGVTAGTCTDGAAAWVIEVTTIPPGVLATLKTPGPVRISEATVLGLMAADGRNWLGIGGLSTGLVLTPLAGPLTTNGLLFEYRDGSSAITTNPNNVKSIVLRLYGETDRQADSLSGHLGLLSDSVTVRVQLRNGR